MNYYLVADTSNFKPFDMSSIALPILTGYRDRYLRYEDILNKIAEENGQYVLPDTPENELYNNILNAFNKDFKAASDDFSNGMNNRNAAAIMDIYRRSRREITPINKAIEAYNKGVDKINALGPDAIIGNKKDLSKIKSYYGGANPIINYRSGKQIELDSIKYFLGISNSLMQNDDFRSILDGQYYERINRGMDGKTALEAALTDYNNITLGEHSKEVLEILNHMLNVMDAQGVEGFSEEAKEQVWNKIASGLIQSIEAPKSTIQHDQSFESAATKATREYHELKLEDERQQKKEEYLLKLDLYYLSRGYIPAMKNGVRMFNDKKEPIYVKAKPEELKQMRLALQKSLTKSQQPPGAKLRITYGDKYYWVIPDSETNAAGISGKNHTFYAVNEKTGEYEIVPMDSQLYELLQNKYEKIKSPSLNGLSAPGTNGYGSSSGING